MGFSSVKEYADTRSEDGTTWISFMYKTGSPPLPAAGWWADLSLSAGIPKYNAYVGTQGEGTPLVGAGNFGLYHGQNVEQLGMTKHLNRIMLGTNTGTFSPAHFILLDYLFFYPLTDMDSLDLQEFDNGVATIPRYPDGKGVRCMLVSTVPQTSNASCTVLYTNQDGVPGRSSTFNVLGPSNVGNIPVAGGTIAGSINPFIPLAAGDYGMRSVQSLQLSGSAGGFCAVVLVQTLASFLIRETNTVTEHFFLKHKPSLPRIKDGAYLNFAFSSGVAAASAAIRGELEFYWG